MTNFLSAISFLTILPFQKKASWENGGMVLYFPLVGLLIGGMLCCADFLFALMVSGEIRAVLDVLFLAVISGGLHLDGLADTADGVLSHKPRERILEIMRDQQIGAMGALALIFCLLLKVSGTMGLEGGARWVWLLTAPALARTAQILGLVFTDYARKEGGIASPLFQKNKHSLLIFCCLPAMIPFCLGVKVGLIVLALFTLLTGSLFLFFQKKIGGMTGDTLGALSEVVEAMILVLGVSLSSRLIF